MALSLSAAPRLAGTSARTFKATASRQAVLGLASRPQRVSHLQCRAQQQEEERSLAQKLAVPAAAVLGAALLLGATPDAAEAARSGGRVGGSSGFSSRRAAPSPAPRIQNNYVYTAPPVVGGWGFGMPFFGGGFGFYPTFGFGFGLSSIFNIIVLLFVINFVISVVQGFTNQKKKNDFDDEDW